LREYLVFPEFLKSSLKQKCGLELVETDSFYNLFNLYKNYFTQDQGEFIVADTSLKNYEKIKNFYELLNIKYVDYATEQSDAAMASFKLSMLNRYYVFKKTTNIDITEPARIIGMNHKINLGKIITPYFDNNNMIIDPSKRSRQINKIYHDVRRNNISTKPSVYLIRHTIPEETLENETFRRNKLEFSLAKKGSDPRLLLIYKSPDKYFYPITYQKGDKRICLFESDKIVNDLDILVGLTDKLNKH